MSTASVQAEIAPVDERARIESLDVLRGFALLGILLINILSFGLHSAGTFNPLIPVGETAMDEFLNLSTWASMSVLVEGAMRCLFSMLFGAGVLLLMSKRKIGTKALHYKRHLWLLAFGLVDAFLLLWYGDILVVYALVGVTLYFVRDWSPRALMIASALLITFMVGVFGVAAPYGLEQLKLTGDIAWTEFDASSNPSTEDQQEELVQRRDSYRTAFIWGASNFVVVAFTLVPDALAMMLLGMALFKLGILDASRPQLWYLRLAATGFGLGLVTNLWELQVAFAGNLELLSTFAMFIPTYHLGRLGMALGYLGAIMAICKSDALPRVRNALATVGRMALTNYLVQSLIGLVVFTGAGFALVGTLERWQLYPIVLIVCAFQVWFSLGWLARYRFGPAEWLWRALAYGKRP